VQVRCDVGADGSRLETSFFLIKLASLVSHTSNALLGRAWWCLLSGVSLVTSNHAHCTMVCSCTVMPTWDPPREAVIYQVFIMKRRTESAKSAARPQSTHPSRVGGGAARRSVCVRDGEGRGRGPAGFEDCSSVLLVQLAAQQPLAACSGELLCTPAGAHPQALDECLQASCS
jgi:hypothetical protein